MLFVLETIIRKNCIVYLKYWIYFQILLFNAIITVENILLDEVYSPCFKKSNIKENEMLFLGK